MDDPLLMRRFERVRDLFRDRQRFVDRDRPARDALRQILAFDELHREGHEAPAFFEPVDRGDVRMIEGREHFRLALEPREPIDISGERRRQDLDRDLAFQLRVRRSKHLAHPAFANLGRDFVDTDTSAKDKGQVLIIGPGCGRDYSWRTPQSLCGDPAWIRRQIATAQE